MLGAIFAVRYSPPFLKTVPVNHHLVHLERLGFMSEDCVRFYVAQLSSGLSFLHEMGIMHRLVYCLTHESRTVAHLLAPCFLVTSNLITSFSTNAGMLI